MKHQTPHKGILLCFLSFFLITTNTSTLFALNDSLSLRIINLPGEIKLGDTLTFTCSGQPLVDESNVEAVGGCGDYQIFFSNIYTESPNPETSGFLSIENFVYTVIDGCGASTSMSFWVKLVDVLAPQIEDAPQSMRISKKELVPPPSQLTAYDDCSNDVIVKYTENHFEESDKNEILRTWTAIDRAGNTSEVSQRIVFKDEPLDDDCSRNKFDGIDKRLMLSNCQESIEVCLPFAIAADSKFTVDGFGVSHYSCSADTLTSYSGLASVSRDKNYEVIWEVSPGVIRGTINSMDSLIALMKENVPNSSWRYNSESGVLTTDYSPRFGELTIIELPSGAIIKSEAFLDIFSDQSKIELLPGMHTLRYEAFGCIDTTQVEVICDRTETRFITAVKGIDASHNLPVADNPNRYSIEVHEENDTDIVEILSTEGSKINFSTIESGRARVEVSLCHLPTSSCQKYNLVFEIVDRENLKPPTAKKDLVVVAYNGQRVVEVLSNDEIIGAPNLTIKTLSEGSARVDARNRIHYQAPKDWCGDDKILYEVCNNSGCDTATLEIQVTCEELLVFSGFSPNMDGENDYFTIVGIENYPENGLVVFNQHGHQVYEKKSYTNNWDGTMNGTPLTDGTYYYVLTIDGLAPKSGYVQIRR